MASEIDWRLVSAWVAYFLLVGFVIYKVWRSK